MTNDSLPTNGEQRRFSVHEHLIYDVIKSQAGSVEKAIEELVMNSVDAGATQCQIDLTVDTFSVTDNGKGFTSRQQIIDNFECFGQPRNGDATFGKFRVGRGQIMAFAACEWTSGPWSMAVDFRNKGIDYVLSPIEPAVNGCSVRGQFYNPLHRGAFQQTCRALVQQLRYVSLAVTLNDTELGGVDINALHQQDPETWPIDTDEYVIGIRNSGGVKVYNQGVYVCTESSDYYGCHAEVISKKALKLNMARNAVLYQEDPHWPSIVQHLRVVGYQRGLTSRGRLNDEVRQHLINALLHEPEVSMLDCLHAKLIIDAKGSHWSILDFLNSPLPVTWGPQKKNSMAETVSDRKLAFVISDRTMEEWGIHFDHGMSFVNSLGHALESEYQQCIDRENKEDIDLDDKISLLDEMMSVLAGKPIVSLSVFDQHLMINLEEVNRKSLSDSERDGLTVLNRGSTAMASALRQTEYGYCPKRSVGIGQSDAADAWTDGTSRIIVEKRQLKLLNLGMAGCLRLAHLLLHEYLHREPDTESHVHNEFFYSTYHDLCIDTPVITKTANKMLSEHINHVRRSGDYLSRRVLKDVGSHTYPYYALFIDRKGKHPFLDTLLKKNGFTCQGDGEYFTKIQYTGDHSSERYRDNHPQYPEHSPFAELIQWPDPVREQLKITVDQLILETSKKQKVILDLEQTLYRTSFEDNRKHRQLTKKIKDLRDDIRALYNTLFTTYHQAIKLQVVDNGLLTPSMADAAFAPLLDERLPNTLRTKTVPVSVKDVCLLLFVEALMQDKNSNIHNIHLRTDDNILVNFSRNNPLTVSLYLADPRRCAALDRECGGLWDGKHSDATSRQHYDRHLQLYINQLIDCAWQPDKLIEALKKT